MKTEELTKIDWIKYMERKRIFFIYFPFIELEGSMLYNVTGFRFNHHLYTYANNLGCHFRSIQELNDSDKHYLDLVKNKDERIKIWRDLGLAYDSYAQILINQFSKISPGDVKITEFNYYYEEFKRILLYTVTIPFLILTAINSDIEKGTPQSDYQGVIELFEPLRMVSRYTDFMNSVMGYFWNSVAKTECLEDYSLLQFLSPKELNSVIYRKSHADLEELKQRSHKCVFWNNPEIGEIKFEYLTDAFRDIPVIMESLPAQETIKGNIAFKGKVTGRVCIVNDSNDMKKFENGDIIVSINTNPTLMPVLIKCSGVITDEGGIMCHAAIVSRELKKPCLIGTKKATKILKDGDLIELDAEKGIVTLLSNL